MDELADSSNTTMQNKLINVVHLTSKSIKSSLQTSIIEISRRSTHCAESTHDHCECYSYTQALMCKYNFTLVLN